MSESLSWDASYAIARSLQARHPSVQLEDVSLEMLFDWVLQIPEFEDDPELANEEILLDIYQDWLEEILEAQYPLDGPAE